MRSAIFTIVDDLLNVTQRAERSPRKNYLS